MERSSLIRITFAAGLLAAVGAVGCSVAQDEETGASPDEVIAAGDISALLKSTLLLEGGCTAAKVGPKQLLVSARCVSGNAAFAAGKTLAFASAAGAAGGQAVAPAAAPDADLDAGAATDAGASKDAGAASSDAGKGSTAKDAGGADAGEPKSGSNAREVTIAEIVIHPSYAAKCRGDLCASDKLASSDAPDVAVIILEEELLTVPSIPVDLDPVGQADPLLVVASGCATLDGKAASAPRTVKTIAVPAKSVVFAGSTYEAAPQLVSRLASSYVVTAAAGWSKNAPRVCSSDLGSPLFRGGSAAVAGITSSYTTYAAGRAPVTTHHTRVDAMSRFKIGDWLSDLGVVTIHSCSETAGGCVKRGYDGGAPEAPATTGAEPGATEPGEGDGGRPDATAPDASGPDGGAAELPEAEEPTGPREETLPSEYPEEDYSEDEDYSDAAAPKKKKKAAAAGCSAAPGGPAPTGELLLAVGLVLGATVVRRRRAR